VILVISEGGVGIDLKIGRQLPLERAIALFEEGMKLSDACRKQLEEAETRVEILTRRAGEMQPQPFKTNDKT